MKEKVKCKKCGLFIDPDCDTCPYCGYPQNKEEDKPIEEASQNNDKRITADFFDKNSDINNKVIKKEKIHFFDFESRVLKVSWQKSLAFFLIGFLFLNLLATIISLIAQSGNWYFQASGTASGAINFACYLIIFGVLFLVLSKDSLKYLKEFAHLDSWLYGVAFGFLLMLASSAVTSFMQLFQQTGSNANENSIDSITTSFPVLSLLVFGIIGPVCEEFTYRIGLFTLVKKYNRALAYIATSVVFGLLHFSFNMQNIVTELINLPSYIVAGLLLCYFYDYKGIGASTVAHVSNNLFALLTQIIMSLI